MIQLRDLLRLELDRDDITNGVANHSGAVNLDGWTASAGFTLTRRTATTVLLGAHESRYAVISAPATGATVNEVWCQAAPVTPGRYIGAAISIGVRDVIASGRQVVAQAHIVFVNATNNIISEHLIHSRTGNATTDISRRAGEALSVTQYTTDLNDATPLVVPATAVTARIRTRIFEGPIGGGVTNALTTATHTTKAHIVTSTDVAMVRGARFTDPGLAPIDLLGDSNTITVTRGGDLNDMSLRTDAGMIDATILGAQYDPQTYARLAAGRRVRLSALEGGTYKALATGSIGPLGVTYPRRRRTRVQFIARDAVAALASTKIGLTYGMDRVNAYLMTLFRAGVRFSIEGASAGPASSVFVADSNVWAELERARDTYSDHLVADKTGVIRVYDTLPTAPVWSFTDTAPAAGTVQYTDVDVDAGTSTIYNTITVTRRNWDEDTGLGERQKTYGPYIDPHSVAQYGPQEANFIISEGDPYEIGKALLARFSTGKPVPRTITFTVYSNTAGLTAAHLTAAVGLELGQAVRVKYAPAAIDTVTRVAGITHKITPDRWTVTVRVIPLETPAAGGVVVNYPTAGALTGPDDTATTPVGLMAERSRTTSFPLPNSMLVTVPFDQLHTEDGIGWDAGTNSFVIPRPGRYLVDAGVAFDPNGSGVRVAEIAVNGGRRRATQVGATSAGHVILPVSRPMRLAEGDRVSIRAYQSSGGNVNLYGDSQQSTSVTVAFIGP